MPEIIIKYKSNKTLAALQDLAKYFDFVISSSGIDKKNRKQITLNGVPLLPADSSIDTSDLGDIFTNKNIDPKQLRDEAWQRKK